MDFTLSPRAEDYRARVRAFVDAEIIPLEADKANYDQHGNIDEPILETLRGKARAAGLWAPQMPEDRGGLGLSVAERAAFTRRPTARSSAPWRCTAPLPTTAT